MYLINIKFKPFLGLWNNDFRSIFAMNLDDNVYVYIYVYIMLYSF